MVESEPVRYELRDIKKDKWRTHTIRNETVLGTAVLAVNDDEGSNTVETIISYTFESIIYWGTYEGVARGLPTEVFENTKEAVKLAKGWGLKEVETKTKVSNLFYVFSYFLNLALSVV